VQARHAERRLEHIVEVARDSGVRLTHQRLEIFRELAGSEEHPDALTVFRSVQGRVPTVSLDTVYRTLWKLHDLGLVSTLGADRDRARFDANLDRHHHFVCVECGAVRDFESDSFDGLRVPETVKALGSVVDTRVEVRGLCARHGRGKTGTDRPRTGRGKRERKQP
jgi:Fur family peroxide stress response transcriptional regulator